MSSSVDTVDILRYVASIYLPGEVGGKGEGGEASLVLYVDGGAALHHLSRCRYHRYL